MVMAKVKGPSIPVETCAEKPRVIVEGLFPTHDLTSWSPTPYVNEEEANIEDRQVANDELVAAAKASDGIPNVAFKTAILAYPDMFRKVMRNCLDEDHFPDI